MVINDVLVAPISLITFHSIYNLTVNTQPYRS